MSKITPPTASLTIEPAQPHDAPRITSLVASAYEKYIPRIGKPPAPMTADYSALTQTGQVFVLRHPTNDSANTLLGSITLSGDTASQTMNINNVVVDPASQVQGYGKLLLDFAEGKAREEGCTELRLFTNVKMYENLGLYARVGYVEVERKCEDGFERVFFRKQIAGLE